MDLELYHLWKCPYSAKVRDHIAELELEEKFNYREIAEDHEALGLLQDKTGGTQVPCLMIDGQPILESAAIVAWINENLAAQSEVQI